MGWTKAVFVAALLAAAGAGVVAPEVAWAEEESVPVRVVVLDQAGAPIPTAVVRHPKEADRHRVNTFDGSWEDSILYLPDGTELRFVPDMVLDLEISAPGFVLQRVQYQIRKRKNVIEVRLAKMELEMAPDEEDEDINIGFGRDVPIDGQ